ncbi:hypothetical protein HZU40_00320 (plasmid) [Mycolicibacterium fluoranthenivorans]|uniref:Uncharacterized protein n=1 Tax=Mycolicibacterium fluoranthenivorans TaxID=258505 RepID=A0A7G8P6H6_9MYCO|nr:hypothetical protein [Mycolicibacterium fluoranthenivorans]QNJ89942.1 hypothetical protein HZU40_00320 [Mycolicibacterium fluoranthenivorans]
MSDMPAAGSVKVVVSAALSDRFEKRYVVVDEATGDVVDDAQGYGYKTAQNAHRAHAYKSMPPKKKRHRSTTGPTLVWGAPGIHAARREHDVLRTQRRSQPY